MLSLQWLETRSRASTPGKVIVIVNMLLMARDQSVLLQKAPRLKGSVEPRRVATSPYALRPLV